MPWYNYSVISRLHCKLACKWSIGFMTRHGMSM